MFCHMCGTKVAEGASFCPNCGTKLFVNDTSQQAATPIPTSQVQPRESDTQTVIPLKKKSKKPPIILGAVALAIVIIIAIAMNWNGKINYEATMRAHQPFAISQGLPYTYGEVLDKYISSPKWEVRESGDANYVDISGKAKGTTKELVVTIKVTEDPSDPDLANIAPESVTIDGTKSPTKNDAVEFLFAMFLMYEERYDDISGLFSEDSIPSGSQTMDGKTPAANTPEESKEEISSAGSQSSQWTVAYTNKIQELAAENPELQFALIDLTESDIPELATDYPGYGINVFTWTNGELVTLMESPYGAGGNLGYEYLPGRNVIRNFNNDQAGAIVNEFYLTVNEAHEVVGLHDESLSLRYFKDTNGNGLMDENEPFSEEPYYYYGDIEITAEQYASYQIPGEYVWITGDKSAEEILFQLNGEIGSEG